MKILDTLINLATFALLIFLTYVDVEAGEWGWAAVCALVFLCLVIEHAANKIVTAVKEKP